MIMFELGQWATPMPHEPSRAISSAFGYTQWATHDRSVPQPTSSKSSIGPAAVDLEAVGVLVDVLGEVGVQADVEPLGQLGGGAS